MNVLEAIWFTTRKAGTVGVIVAEDEVTKERKVYVGQASGLDETTDAQWILDWGVRLKQERWMAIAKVAGWLGVSAIK